MHTLLANAAQPYELAGYPTFTAEVASTAHELLLANMMVERAKTKEDKLFYLGQIMENYRGTFFRQSMFAEFQLAINDLANKGEGLSGEKMSALYLDLLKRYHGPKVQVEPAYSSEWAYIQHFYFGFYVWQYATSITAANFFAQKVMHGTAADRDHYLAVLRAGGSDYGYNLLKIGRARYGDGRALSPDHRQLQQGPRPGRSAALIRKGRPNRTALCRDCETPSASRTGSCGGPWRGRTSCARRRAGRGSGSRPA